MSVPSSIGGPGSVTSGGEEAREGTSCDPNVESTRAQKSSKNLRSHDLCITGKWLKIIFSCYFLERHQIMSDSWKKCDSVNLWLGYPKRHKVLDGYVRCRLCLRDISVGSRGLSALKEHFDTVRHKLKDTKYRLLRDLPLIDKEGRLLSEDQVATAVAAIADEPPCNGSNIRD